MRILELECRAEDVDTLVAELWSRGVEGIEEVDTPGGGRILKAYFESEIDTTGFARYAPRWHDAIERDWIAVSRAQWKHVLAGERFFLAPEWSGEPAPPGRLRLVMRSGAACGSGWGEPTQLMLECMERVLRPGSTVLDLGTGTGILAAAAALLGAGRIYACDIDHEATKIAARRFREDGVAAHPFTGSARSVRSAAIDLVLANINAASLAAIAPELERIRAANGTLVLGGFREKDLERIGRAFHITAQPLEKNGWLAVLA